MTNQVQPDNEQSFFSHLVELRDRLLKMVLCVLLVFVGTASYANEIYAFWPIRCCSICRKTVR